MRLNLERKFPPILGLAQRYLLKRQIRSYEPYHPIFIAGEEWAPGERSCIDRWEMSLPYLQSIQPHSFLDLGCAEGFFVQRAAHDLGCLSLGVDADNRRITIAKMVSTVGGYHNTGFIEAIIDNAFLSKLPKFDAVMFLSVLHHIMYEHGVEYSLSLLHHIYKITKDCFIFDMGQSNETSHSWSSLLPDMGDNPQAWILDLLRSAGFSSVEILGDTDAYKSDSRRYLFMARP